MKCNKCSSEVSGGLKFCENCGAPIVGGASKEKSKLPLIIFLAVVGALLICGGVILAINVMTPKSSQTQLSNTSPSLLPSAPANATAEPTSLAIPTVAPSAIPSPVPTPFVLDASVYVPLPNKKFITYFNYEDGEKGSEEVWTVAAGGNEIVSTINVSPRRGEIYFFTLKTDGIYTALSTSPNTKERWLPNNLTVGAVTNSTGVKRRVLKVGQTLTLKVNGVDTQFANCIVIQEDFVEAMSSSISWFAPGMGIVYQTDLTGKYVESKLTGYGDVPADKALKFFNENKN